MKQQSSTAEHNSAAFGIAYNNGPTWEHTLSNWAQSHTSKSSSLITSMQVRPVHTGSLGSAPLGQHVLYGSLLMHVNMSGSDIIARSINERECWSSCCTVWSFGSEASTHDLLMVIEIRQTDSSNCLKSIVV